jgi:polysaccharide biosynthesis transport protein
MLRVRFDDYAADGTARVDAAPTAEHDMTRTQAAGRPHLTGDLHFSEVVAILRRRSRLILAITGIGTVLAIVVGLLVPPKYTAVAQLVVSSAPAGATERTIDEAVDTHVTLLSSRDHLQRVIKSLRQDPKFRPAAGSTAGPEPAPGASLDVSQSAASEQPTDLAAAETTGLSELKRRLNVWLAELRSSARTTVPPIDDFELNTKVIQERRSRVISVAFKSTSPAKAAAFANRIVQVYVDSLTEQKQAWLDEQIAEAKYEMDRARAAVQKVIQQRNASEPSASREERASDGQLRELLRQVGTSAEHYDNLLRRRKEMRDQQDTVSSGLEIHSAELPKWPSTHNPILFIFPALIVFAIGGSWLAVVLERLDRGLRSREETADLLGISCIGLVPQLPREHAIRADQHLLAEPFSVYAEAIRSAVATLGLAAGPTRTSTSKVILISSSVPGEGKTTLALSLAAYIGSLGRRVLLVDLDLRKGSKSGGLDDTAERGIIDLSLQNRPLAELIQHIPGPGLDHLPLASYCVDPLALFASEQMPDLVRQLRERYDCVIIDGPPALGAVEARLLRSFVDRLVFVVKWGSTRRELAQNTLRLLRDSGCLNKDPDDAVTAIVTQVDLKRHARYHYGDAGEFAVKYAGYYSSSARPDTGDNGALATAHESQPGLGPSLLQRIVPMGEIKLQGIKTGQPFGPKTTGDGTDGRSR